jgi:hypothetical protein
VRKIVSVRVDSEGDTVSGRYSERPTDGQYQWETVRGYIQW